jgi:hypothetical protein
LIPIPAEQRPKGVQTMFVDRLYDRSQKGTDWRRNPMIPMRDEAMSTLRIVLGADAGQKGIVNQDLIQAWDVFQPD